MARGRPPGRPAVGATGPRPLSSTEVAAKLKARFPCRDDVIEELLDVLVGSEGGIVFFEGPASTGKTAILRSALSLLGARHAFVDCISCPDARSIARSIASQLGGSASVRAVARGADGEGPDDLGAADGPGARGSSADAGAVGMGGGSIEGNASATPAQDEVDASGAAPAAAPSAAAALSALLAELPRLAPSVRAVEQASSPVVSRTAWVVLDEAHRLAGSSLLEALCQLPEAAPGALGILAVSRLAPGSGAFLGPPGADLARTVRVPPYDGDSLQVVLQRRLEVRVPELVLEMAARKAEGGEDDGLGSGASADSEAEPLGAWPAVVVAPSSNAASRRAALRSISSRLVSEHLPRFLALFCPSFARASTDVLQAERAALALFPRYVEPVLEGARAPSGGGFGRGPAAAADAGAAEAVVLPDVAPGVLLRRIRESLRAAVAAAGAGGVLTAQGPRRQALPRPPLGRGAAALPAAELRAWRRASGAGVSAIHEHELEPSEGEEVPPGTAPAGPAAPARGTGPSGCVPDSTAAAGRPPFPVAERVAALPARRPFRWFPLADAAPGWLGWSSRFPPRPPSPPPATSAAPPPAPPLPPAELPRAGRLLAVASYVASRVPAKKDRATFDPSLKARRKRPRLGDGGGGAGEGGGGVDAPSQLPKPFSKERLLAIYYVLHAAAGEGAGAGLEAAGAGGAGGGAAKGLQAPGPLEACPGLVHRLEASGRGGDARSREQASTRTHAAPHAAARPDNGAGGVRGRHLVGPLGAVRTPPLPLPLVGLGGGGGGGGPTAASLRGALSSPLARSAMDAEVQSMLATLCALRLVAPATRADGEGVGEKTLVSRLSPQQARAMARAEGIQLADYLTVSA